MKNVQQKYRELSAEELAKIVCQVALDNKAENLVALDVSQISGFADYFVIMSGTSTRHTTGLAAAIERKIGSKRMMAGNTEGLNDGSWILLDYNDVIIHIFYSETREYYYLEGLWQDAPGLVLTDLS